MREGNNPKMEILLMKIKQKLRSFPFLLMIGIMMLLGSIYFQYSSTVFFKTAIKTTATITDIESYSQGDDEKYDVYIDYTIDDETYHSKYDEYYSGMYIGQTLTTYYNPDNPYENKSGNSRYMGFLLLAFSILWTTMMYKIQK